MQTAKIQTAKTLTAQWKRKWQRNPLDVILPVAVGIMLTAIAACVFLALAESVWFSVPYESTANVIGREYHPEHRWTTLETRTDNKGKTRTTTKSHYEPARYEVIVETKDGPVSVAVYRSQYYQMKEGAIAFYTCRIGRWTHLAYHQELSLPLH